MLYAAATAAVACEYVDCSDAWRGISKLLYSKTVVKLQRSDKFP
jgi:hypothetical protein